MCVASMRIAPEGGQNSSGIVRNQAQVVCNDPNPRGARVIAIDANIACNQSALARDPHGIGWLLALSALVYNAALTMPLGVGMAVVAFTCMSRQSM